MLEALGQILWVVIALALVLGLAWVLLRWMNKRVPGMGGGARLIKVLDRVALGKSGSLLLVRVQDKVLLVAFSERAVEKLCEFDDPDGTLSLPDVVDTPSFAAALKDAAAKIGIGGKDGKGDGSGTEPPQGALRPGGKGGEGK